MSRRTRPQPPTVSPPVLGGPLPGDSVCGYRLVRKLGEGPRAQVYLGFGAGTAEPERASTAALKICRPAAGPTAMVELEALARAGHPHVVRLADAATTASGEPCIVLERLSRGSLAHLLERRESLRAGEAITILAPIAVAVDALHTSGVVHGSIGAPSVLFRESGAPVLARFGRASLIEPGLAPALLAPAVADDRAALAGLAALVLARVPGPDAERLADWALESATDDAFGEALAGRLFELGTPEAVVFDAAAVPIGSAVPARTVPTLHPAVHQVGIAARLGARLPALLARVAVAVAGLRVVRTPVWVAAASVVVAIVAALVLIPGNADDAPATPANVTSQEPAASIAPEPTAPVDASTQTTTADDPLAALPELLTSRAECLDQLSVLCLDAVDQSGSAALDDDAELVSGVREGGELPAGGVIQAKAPELVERLGDSALVRLGGNDKPASVLMIRTEAGWRIRDYLG